MQHGCIRARAVASMDPPQTLNFDYKVIVLLLQAVFVDAWCVTGDTRTFPRCRSTAL